MSRGAFALGTAKDFENAAESLKVCWNTILAVYEENLAEGMTIEALKGTKSLTAANCGWTAPKHQPYFNLNATPEVKAAGLFGQIA